MLNMGNEWMWKRYCDTIGDYFKNKYVTHIIVEWYRVWCKKKWIEKSRDLKVWKNRKNKKLGFTEEYEEFIKLIFQDATDMEDFLVFLKAEYIDNEEVSEWFKKIFHTWDFIRLFLSFREVTDQLYFDTYDRVSRLTIGGIFATRVAYILEKAHSVEVSETNETSIHRAMEQMYEKWISPISSDGKILCYLWEWEAGGFEVKELGQKENIVFEVKRNGFDILDADDFVKEKWETPLDIHAELDLLRKYFQFHKDIDSTELSEEEEDWYFKIKIDWESENKWNTKSENEIAFWRYLEWKIQELEQQIRKNARVVNLEWEPVDTPKWLTERPQNIPKWFKLYPIPNTSST